VELTGLEPRRSDLARGIVIARAARALDASEQRALWAALAAANVTEASDPDEPSVTAGPGEDEDAPPRQWLAGSWMPPAPHEVDAQKLALEAVAARYGLEVIHLFKIETAVDGVAFLEEAALAEVPDDDDEDEVTGETEAVSGLGDEHAEVIYAAPDAGRVVQGTPPDADDEDDDEDDDDDLELDDIQEVEMESHWRAGLPPLEQAVPFPLEGYPEVLEEVTGERFGIALKLSGPALPGEESVVNAFFALWLSVFQDERADEFEPFQRADVVHDRRHRSALMWVEGFAVPATSAEQTHFLMWIIARINDVIPIAWARYERVDDAVKARATASSDDDDDDAGEPFVLAGNPFADRFRRHGEEGALAWAVGQSAWSKRELAGMIIEVALEHDPDSVTTAPIAERLLRRALALDPASDATGYLAIVLVRQNRIPEAVTLGASTDEADVRVLVVGEIAEHAPDELPEAYALLDRDTLDATDPEEIAELCVSIARHAPNHLNGALELLPPSIALVPYLYNSSFSVERPQALALLSAVLAMPEPPKGSGEARAAYVMAWNNSCIHAHALGDYSLAVSLATAGQRFGPENPFIYHSGACAYAAVGDIDKAIDQVRLAIEHDYEHAEKMETDSDLQILHGDPRFSALFVEWREKRADLN